MEGSVSPQIGQSDAKKQRSLLSRAGPAIANLTLIALVLAIGYGGYSYLKSTRVQTPQRPAGEIARAVEAYPIRVGTYRPVLQLYGQITARRSVDLRVLVSGEVIAIADGLRNGGKVAAGEALVVVDQFEYDGALVRAKAEVAEAEARVAETRARIGLEQAALVQAREQRRITERELERLTTLERRGATSTALVDASKLRLSAAIATTEVRENQVKILEAQLQPEIAALDRLRWNVEKAERDIKNTRLLAPFDGTISEPAADVGRLVNINDRIATLIDTSEYDVRFTLGDGQYGRLAFVGNALTGREVSVSWKAGGNEFRTAGARSNAFRRSLSHTGGFDAYARLYAGSGTRFHSARNVRGRANSATLPTTMSRWVCRRAPSIGQQSVRDRGR